MSRSPRSSRPLAPGEAVAPAVQDALQVIPKGRDQVDGLGQLALTPVGG